MRATRDTPTGAAMAMATFIVLLAGPAAAQEDQQITVTVEHIAGANLYFDAGLTAGLAVGDTVAVIGESSNDLTGYVVVLTASDSRCMVTFASQPFPVTRGQTLRLLPVRSPPDGGDERSVIMTQRVPGPQYFDRTPTLSGRVSIDVDGLQSRTEPINTDTLAVMRTFVTPAVRFRVNVGQLPGGFNIQTNMRYSSRYAPESSVPPQRSTRIYQASVSRSADGVQVQLGRFYNPYEEYSGYWDGALVRFGSRAFGVGAAVGFEPNRVNEVFSSEFGKYTAFVDYTLSKNRFHYETDISFHQLLPSQTTGRHTYLGWSQTLAIGRFRFSQRTQVDRNPDTDQWVFTNVQFRLTAPVASGVSVRARYSLRRPYLLFRLTEPFSPPTEDASVGLFLAGPAGSIGLDATADRIDGGEIGWSYASFFNLSRTWMDGLRFSGVLRYWTRRGLTGYYASPAVSYMTEGVRWSLDYRLYVTDLINGTLTTHGGTIATTVPLGARSYTSFKIGLQHGTSISNVTMGGSLSVSF